MKKILLVSTLCTLFVYADLSVEQIREMVTKIHEKRAGIEMKILETTEEPFVRLEKENNVTTFVLPKKSEEIQLKLHAILNEKAYINSAWQSIDNVVGGYTLKYIGKQGVVLRNENKIKKLFLHQDRANFIIIEGRE